MSRLTSLLLQIWFFLTAPFHHRLVTHKYKTVHEINYTELKDAGVTLLIFDLDDTLANWRTNLPKEILELFQTIQNDVGLSIAILSNTTKKRVRKVIKTLNDDRIIILQTPSKPLITGYTNLMSLHTITPNKTAMIGDRLATDMWGAKRAGITTRILVEPYSKHMEGKRSPFVQKIIRGLEKLLNGHYFR